MKLRLAALAALLFVFALGWGLAPKRVALRAPAVGAAPAKPAPPPSPAPRVAASVASLAPVASAPVRDAVTLAATCGLDVQLGCAAGTCVALASAPDLDGPLGWLTLAWRAPGFVWAALARDVGLPLGVAPCGSAVRQLTASHGALGVKRADGSELWCTGEGPGLAAACDAVGRARFGTSGFTAPTVRALRF